MAKLHDYYKDEVVAKLMTEFNYNLSCKSLGSRRSP